MFSQFGLSQNGGVLVAQATQFHLNKCPSNTTGLTKDCSCETEVEHYLNLAKWSFGLFVFEFLGGLFSFSLALISDACHVLADGAENMINVAVSRLSRKNGNEEYVRKVGGIISGWLLFFMGTLIVHEGWERMLAPHEVKEYMVIFAIIGLGVNLRQKWLHNQSLPEHRNRQYFWQNLHLWSDVAASVAVIFGGLIMLISKGWYWLDGALSIAIGGWIITITAMRLFGKNVHRCDEDHRH